MKKRTMQEGLDAISAQVAGELRKTFVKYKSLTEHLVEVQRGIEAAKSICQTTYKVVDGPCWEVLATDPRYRTDEFIQRLYDAMTNTSIRKWTRQHLALVKETQGQLESASRKAEKLRDRFDANPSSPEAKATALLLKRMSDTKNALAHRVEFTVRKFLELRLCVLKTLTGTSEMMFGAADGILTKEMLEQFSAATRQECERVASTDEVAIRNGRRRK